MVSKSMWMVRAGEGGYLFDEFKAKNVVAIGWNDLGDLSSGPSLETIKESYRKHYSGEKDGKVNASCGMIRRFRFDFSKGDYVVTYNPVDRKYLVGEIIGDYAFNTQLLAYQHIHSVKWLGEVGRDVLSLSTRNTLGAISTIFELGEDAQADMLKAVGGSGHVTAIIEQKAGHDEVEEEALKESMVENAREFIKDKVMDLDWEEMQELVAGLLRGMGYKTMVSPRGPDRGSDIQASPDGLGLENPRIVVEVKHRSGQMGAPAVRGFITTVGKDSRGLYVSTGGFSTEAKYEADRSSPPITIIDADRLVGLLIQYYDNLDSDTRALVPLVKIYWPA